MPFDVVHRLADFMDGFPAEWFVTGGWAIDLFLGRTTREHKRLTIAVLRDDQLALRERFDGWTVLVQQGGLTTDWALGETLLAPVVAGRAQRAKGDPAVVGFQLHPSAHGRWLWLKNLMIALPLARMGGRTPEGIPYLAPEIVLLEKAMVRGKKEDQEFRTALRSMSGQARIWLRDSLKAVDPAHFWLEVDFV
jgi:GNAT superfamily N-acetyltransferase